MPIVPNRFKINGMKQKEMEAVIETRFKKINNLLRQVVARYSADDIHRFRVEIKKLKAFLSLLNSDLSGWQVPARLPERLNRFYHLVGDIRHLQLQQQYIQDAVKQRGYGVPLTYLDTIDTAIAEKINEAEELVQEYRSFDLEKKHITDRLPGKLDCAMATKFAESGISTFWEELLKEYPDDKSFHAVRKALKGLVYTWQYFDADTLALVKGELAGKNSIKSQAALLGDLLDAGIGIGLFEKNSIGGIADKNERMLLLHIEKQWRREKLQIKEQIYEALLINNSCLKPAEDNNNGVEVIENIFRSMRV